MVANSEFDRDQVAGTALSDSDTTVAREIASPAIDDGDDPAPRKKDKVRRSTAHLKLVPDTLELREVFKVETERYARTLDRTKPFTKNDLETHGRTLLEQMGQPEKFLGFAMVLIGNFFWKQQFLAIPFHRRLLLLPHCLKHAEGCPADYDEFGLDCETCGACSIADYKVKAEQLGYKVLVAEGSPIVLKIIVSGHVDGILGVACLNVLEKAIDKILIAGVPSYAIPLHSGDCKNTTLDQPWVWEVLDKYEELPQAPTTSYVPLMRAANEMFDQDLGELLPRLRSQGTPDDLDSPLAATEAISYDWLVHGGKRFRPFMTLAAYDAATGGAAVSQGAGDHRPQYSAGIRRVSMAIEAFHKASLVHDDIEDDDQFRYGQETLHRRFGLGTAINVGDHLIGLGYRLVSMSRGEIGAEAAADIVDRMALAHIKLCDGQGAEMEWLKDPLKLKPIDALQIYALKTSPAFEAALYAGLRLAGPATEYEESIPTFSRHLGVGFQILNDLKDWRGDNNNKLIAGQDAAALRPTVLLALALEAASPSQRKELESLVRDETSPTPLKVGRMRRIFEACRVFDTADSLVGKSRARAEAIADNVQPESLRQLMYFLVDMVLAPESSEPAPTSLGLVALPIVSAS